LEIEFAGATEEGRCARVEVVMQTRMKLPRIMSRISLARFIANVWMLRLLFTS